ncbi:MAG: ankyrin repeat domain-containing protein [Rickettsiaceae bacterium H1]|nr:ankyrin repeat domain-containing protein [Rickettsiaceae bacterium H1]
MIYAAREGHSDIVKPLIEEKANVNAQTKEDFTALMHALQFSEIEAKTQIDAVKAESPGIAR